MIATSDIAKLFITDEAASHSAPSKSKPEGMLASQREIVDALVRFVEANRYSQEVETNDEGEEIVIELDRFAETVQAVLAERMTTTATRNGATVKLAKAEQELAELKAQLAALKGETVES